MKETKADVAFPILKLPYLPLEIIIRNMKTFELFQLSLTSAASRKKIKQVRFHCLNKSRIIIHSRQFDNRQFLIIPEEGPYRRFGFLKIWASKAPESEERGKRSIAVLNGVKMTLENDLKSDSNGYLYTEGGSENYMLAMKFLVDTFECIFDRFNINFGNYNYEQYKPELAIADEWQHVKISEFGYGPAYNKPVPNEAIYKFCENLKVTKSLEFEMNFQPNFELPPLFRSYIENIELTGNWLNGDVLSSLNCRNLKLTYTTLTAREVLKFLMSWYNSDNKVLRDFEIYQNVKKIARLNLRAFNPTKFKIEDRESESEEDWASIHCEFGYDIKRKDGMIGSICQDGQDFQFFVWHHDFTDKKSG